MKKFINLLKCLLCGVLIFLICITASGVFNEKIAEKISFFKNEALEVMKEYSKKAEENLFSGDFGD